MRGRPQSHSPCRGTRLAAVWPRAGHAVVPVSRPHALIVAVQAHSVPRTYQFAQSPHSVQPWRRELSFRLLMSRIENCERFTKKLCKLIQQTEKRIETDHGSRERIPKRRPNCSWAEASVKIGIAEICEVAQVNKGTFYHFFSSKLDLLLEVMDRYVAACEATRKRGVDDDTRNTCWRMSSRNSVEKLGNTWIFFGN